MMQTATNLEKLSTHIHFRGGVNMGIGTFNLVRTTESVKIITAASLFVV